MYVCFRTGSNSCENEIATSLADCWSKISYLKHTNKLVGYFLTYQNQNNELVAYIYVFEKQSLGEERTFLSPKCYFQVRELS